MFKILLVICKVSFNVIYKASFIVIYKVSFIAIHTDKFCTACVILRYEI